MEVLLAKSAGFCFGVKRAVDRVYELAQTSAKIYTYGPIIHNEEVVGDLEKKGVSVIETKEELRQIKEGVIVIRSHGVAKEIYDQIEQQGLECVDATCPFVKRIHNIVEKESANGLWGGQVPLRWWRSAPKKSNRSTVIPISRFVLCRRRHLTTINFKNLLKFSKKKVMILVL